MLSECGWGGSAAWETLCCRVTVQSLPPQPGGEITGNQVELINMQQAGQGEEAAPRLNSSIELPVQRSAHPNLSRLVPSKFVNHQPASCGVVNYNDLPL